MSALSELTRSLADFYNRPKFGIGLPVLLDGKTPGVVTRVTRHVKEWPDQNDLDRTWKCTPWTYTVITASESDWDTSFGVKKLKEHYEVGEHRLTDPPASTDAIDAGLVPEPVTPIFTAMGMTEPVLPDIVDGGPQS